MEVRLPTVFGLGLFCPKKKKKRRKKGGFGLFFFFCQRQVSVSLSVLRENEPFSQSKNKISPEVDWPAPSGSNPSGETKWDGRLNLQLE